MAVVSGGTSVVVFSVNANLFPVGLPSSSNSCFIVVLLLVILKPKAFLINALRKSSTNLLLGLSHICFNSLYLSF